MKRRENRKYKNRRQRCRAAKRKDYQLQECLGICVRPGCAIQQNKIPVIEMLSIARHNRDMAGTEREIRRGENNCTGHRPCMLQLMCNVFTHHCGPPQKAWCFNLCNTRQFYSVILSLLWLSLLTWHQHESHNIHSNWKGKCLISHWGLLDDNARF